MDDGERAHELKCENDRSKRDKWLKTENDKCDQVMRL